jgi:hypothetical protein
MYLDRKADSVNREHVHPIMKNSKNAILKFQEKLKKCTHVYPMLTLICAYFGIKKTHKCEKGIPYLY